MDVGRGIVVIGTLGVLEQAASSGLLLLRGALEDLQRTDFRLDPKLIEESLRRAGQGGVG